MLNPVLDCGGSWLKKLQSQQNLLFQEHFDTWRALASRSVTVGSVIEGSRDNLLWHQHFTSLGTDFKEKQHRCRHVSVMESHEKLNIKGRAVRLLNYLFIDNRFFRNRECSGLINLYLNILSNAHRKFLVAIKENPQLTELTKAELSG